MSASRTTINLVAMVAGVIVGTAIGYGIGEASGPETQTLVQAPGQLPEPMLRPSGHPLPSPADRTAVSDGYWLAGRDLRPGVWTMDSALAGCRWTVQVGQDWYNGSGDVRSFYIEQHWTLATQGCGVWRWTEPGETPR